MKKLLSNYLILAFGVLFISTAAIFVRLADAPPSITAFYRLFITVILMLPFLIAKKDYIKELKELSKKDIFWVLCSGLFLAFHYILWFESLLYTSVASSTVLVALQPVFAVIGGYYIFKENYSTKAIIGLIIAIFGSFIIGYDDFQVGGKALLGDILAIIAAILITLHFFVAQSLRKKVSVIPYSIIIYGASAFYIAIYAIIRGYSFTGYNSQTWIIFIAIAICATILGQLVLIYLLKVFTTSIVSMGILAEPIFASIMSYFVLNELVTFLQVIGMIIIIFGIIFFFKVKASYCKLNI